MTKAPVPHARAKGRPRSSGGKDIPDDLLRALRNALSVKSHDELTLKEIAAEAGTSQEMVRYYYGSKDGLITAMMLQSSRQVERSLSELREQLETADPADATKLIVVTLIRLYLSERPTTRVSLLEYQKEKSALKDSYLTRRSNIVISALHDIFASLINRGIYRRSSDPRHLALSMMVVAGHPVQLLWALPEEWLTPEMLESPSWINHVVSLFECQCASMRTASAAKRNGH